jgi:hypothetical protein
MDNQKPIKLAPGFKEDFAQWLSRAIGHYAAEKQYDAHGPFFKLLSVAAKGEKVFVDVNGMMIGVSADLESVSPELVEAIESAQRRRRANTTHRRAGSTRLKRPRN